MKNTLAILTAFFTATFFAAPFVTSPFMGFRPDQLPVPQIDPPVQPAGYAFSIWGLIYLWLAVSAVYGLWKRGDDADWNRVRLPLMISLAAGTPWLAVANASAIWATGLIIVMALAAIAALALTTDKDRWLLRAPVGIYAGWLTAASFVSLGSTAAGYGLFFDSLGWAFVSITGALLVALAVQRRVPRAPEYGLTVIWALVGIMVANGTAVIGVTVAAAIGIAVIAAVTLTGFRGARAA